LSTVSISTLKSYWLGVYNTIATIGSAKKTTALQIAGQDGTNAQIIKTDSSGNQIVIGAEADHAAATLPPVKVAGKYTLTAPVYHDGDITTLRTAVDGSQLMTLSGSNLQAIESQYAKAVHSSSATKVLFNQNVALKLKVLEVYIAAYTATFELKITPYTDLAGTLGTTWYILDQTDGALKAALVSLIVTNATSQDTFKSLWSTDTNARIVGLKTEFDFKYGVKVELVNGYTSATNSSARIVYEKFL